MTPTEGDIYAVAATSFQRIYVPTSVAEVVRVSVVAEEELTADERAGLELVRDTGGIHQSDFWKELGVSSRKGSRIVESLVEKSLVDREDTVYNGHNTYYISPTARDLEFSMLMAGDMLSPFIGEEEVDENSDAFSQWIMNLAYEE
jgi:DNA-binding MarR family transcriptional regulator